MKKNNFLFLAVLSIMVLYSCSSTSIVSSWKDPSSTDNPDQWEKVLIAVQSTSDAARRVAEDDLAAMSEKFYPSYMIFPDKASIQNEDELKRKIENGGYDAIATLKLINKDRQTSYVPGSYTGSYWGYHRGYWGGYYEPGYYREDTYYAIETHVFSLKEGKLVWSSITNTVNPSDIKKTIQEVAVMTLKQMEKDGFVSQVD